MSSDIQHARRLPHVKRNFLLLRSRRLFLFLKLPGSVKYKIFAFINFETRFFHQMTVCGIFYPFFSRSFNFVSLNWKNIPFKKTYRDISKSFPREKLY